MELTSTSSATLFYHGSFSRDVELLLFSVVLAPEAEAPEEFDAALVGVSSVSETSEASEATADEMSV